MTRETKVGLLFGMALILVIGILVSDFLVEPPSPAPMTEFAGRVQPADLNRHNVRLPEPLAPAGRREVNFPLPSPTASSSSQLIDQPVARNNNPPPRATATTYDPAPTFDQVLDQRESLTRRSPAQRQDSGFDSNPQPQPGYVTPGEDRFVINEPPVEIRPLEQPAGYAPPTPTQQRGPEVWHTVQRNETLYRIAEQYYQNAELWRVIQDANPTRVGADGSVREGVRLLIPQRADLASLPQFVRVDDRAAADALPRPTANATTERIVIVEQNQTLSEIAAEYLGSSRRWPELLEANRDQLASDRDLRPGMKLRIPGGSVAANTGNNTTPAPPATGRTYTVKANDTLYRIAVSQLGNGNRWREIQELNKDKISRPDDIKPGMVLRLP